jgi:hypothetical protein
MALPALNEFGELPEGVFPSTFSEVVERFGHGSLQRQKATTNLRRILAQVQFTGAFDRMVLFGSYVTAKESPNDVDVVLVMRDDFRLSHCPSESLALFDHDRAAIEFGASVFWIRPAMLIGGETLAQFIAKWQVTRESRFRGIIEVRT